MMGYYYVKSLFPGASGDLVKATDAESAALKFCKKYNRAPRVAVYEIIDRPITFEPETEVEVTGVRRVD